MQKIENVWKALDKPISYLAGFCVASMLICVFLQVVARTFRFSINWTTFFGLQHSDVMRLLAREKCLELS